MTRGLSTANRYLLASTSALGILMASVSAAGADPSLESELAALRAEVQALRKEVAAAKAQASGAAAKAAAAEKAAEEGAPDLEVHWKGSPEFKSKDGRFKFKVRGRIHLDANFADQGNGVSGATTAGVNTVPGDINATRFRRARLGVQGTVFKDIDYILEADFADDRVALTDAYLQYTALPVGIRIGQFKTFNALEEMTSSNYITFLERAAFLNAFQLGVRRIGVGAIYDKAKHWTASAGYFGANSAEIANEESTVFGARVTLAPLNSEKHLVHFGASVRERQAGDLSSGSPPFGYSARAADLSLTSSFVNTNTIGKSDTFWGLEAAGVWGPFSVQAEYGELEVDPVAAVGNFALTGRPTYEGWYVDGSVFLTGERRPYDKGSFGRVKVKNPIYEGGKGAWQIAGRWDVLDLSDNGLTATSSFGAFNCVPINAGATSLAASRFLCGRQETWLIGVNWYLNDYTRLMFNYNESEIEGGVNDGLKVKGVGMRAQVDW